MPKKNVAVVMGGYSSEYQISVKSGKVVCENLNKQLYNVFPIHILEEKWVYVREDAKEIPVDKSDFSIEINHDKVKFDVVFNAIHGHPGEDGLLLAYFELLGIPHTSDTSYKMALTFNKRDCLSVLTPYGIPHAQSIYVNKGEKIDFQNIANTLGFPCFVKANRAGSSFGVTKAYTIDDLPQALENAFKEDQEVLIEAFLDGTEVSVGAITHKGNVTILPITEIVSENDFFDFEAKYLGKSQEITPARITPEQEKAVREIAEKTYRALGMKGFTRSEYIFKNGIPHLLEVNTVPGMTTESILPQQARQAGITLDELFGEAVENALKKQ